MYAGRRGRRPLPRSTPHPHGRARRPRRAAPTGRPRDDIGDAHGRAGRQGRRPLPRSTPHPHGRARRPRRAVAHGTTSETPTCTRAAGDVGPYHAPRHIRTRTPRAAHARHVRTRTPCAHLVGRDVLGAPRPRNAHGTTSKTPTGTRAAGDVGPYHVPHHTPMVGRDVLGAPRPRNAHGTTSQTPTGARAAGDVGPYHAPRHVRTRTPRAAHARHVRTRTPCARLPCQRIETLMGFRNAVAKSRTRACHAFASFTAPAPLQVAPAQ